MNIRERVNRLLSEDCKGKLEGFEDFELRSIYEHTFKMGDVKLQEYIEIHKVILLLNLK